MGDGECQARSKDGQRARVEHESTGSLIPLLIRMSKKNYIGRLTNEASAQSRANRYS
jgi:hypothetical protein